MLFTKTAIVAAAASLSFLGGNGVIGSSPLEESYAKDEGSYVKEFGRVAGQNGRVKVSYYYALTISQVFSIFFYITQLIVNLIFFYIR